MYVLMNPLLPVTLTHIPRNTGRGGRFAAIFNSALLINPKPKQNFSSFENRMSDPTVKTLSFIVYGASGPYTEF